MRVITGSARGRKLKTLEGTDVRPTTDMVKESIFSIIQFDIDVSEILDLLSGSGQLGIEAISRGAKYCRYIDKNREAADITRENVNAAGFKDISYVANLDSIDFLKSSRHTFDIALLDPPYNMGLHEKVLPLLEPRMSERGIVVCEHEKGLVLPDEYGRLKKKKTYRYGKVELTVYRVPFNEEG